MSASDRSHPFLYEINTRCWLRALGDQAGGSFTLNQVPENEFHNWRRLGFTHIWLMGVWRTGPAARRQSLQDDSLWRFHSRHFPGLPPEQTVGGSPYAIHGYRVSRELGGMEGLARFRRRLHEHDLKLILDFVPNHVALDHPWTRTHPERFITRDAPADGFFPVEDEPRRDTVWLAHGRDPHFPPWRDTAQLDYRSAATRESMIQQLLEIATCCDGVRCDMAMLLLRDVFAKTWPGTESPMSIASDEFWSQAIARVKSAHPNFLMLAEVYWDREARLQDLGFDFTYDKVIYDTILRQDPNALRARLQERWGARLERDIHFLENHDEVRVARALPWEHHRCAALLTLSLPGMRLLHQGQRQGACEQIPVQMRVAPPEPIDAEISRYYESLLLALHAVAPVAGSAQALPAQPWRAEDSFPKGLIAYTGKAASGGAYLICVNLSDAPVRARLPWLGLHQATPPEVLFQTSPNPKPGPPGHNQGTDQPWQAEAWEGFLGIWPGDA